jgi:PPOX class probable F420-dependent enzyme
MDAIALTPAQTAFLNDRNFATIATLDDDGAPRQAVIWYRLEDDGRIMINSRHPRRWPHNLLRDGRIAFAVPETGDPMRWLGFTGVLDEVVEDVAQAREDIVALAHRYSTDGTVDPDTEATFRSQPRITFQIRLTGVYDHLDG